MKNKKLWGRLLILPAALFMAWCFSACQHDPDIIKPDETDPALADYQVIKAMGYDVTDIYDAGDYYVVEGDIAIPKDYVKERAKKPETRQDYLGDNCLISYENQNPIKVRVGPYLKSNTAWYTQIKQAMIAWNNIPNHNIKFEEASDYDFTNICINEWTYPESSGLFSAADIPSYGSAGSYIWINSSFSLNDAQKKMQAIHLLGHTIGLGHATFNTSSSIIDDITFSGYLIPGTPVTDDQSVMAQKNIGTPFVSFSSGDILAIQKLYPKVTFVPLAIKNPVLKNVNDISSCLVDDELTFQVTGNFEGPDNKTISYKWEGNNMVIVSGSGTNTVKVRFTQPGQQQIAVTVTVASSLVVPSSVSQKLSLTLSVADRPLKINSLDINCPNQTYYREDRITFTANGSFEGPSDKSVTYDWSGDNMVIESGQGSSSIVAYFTAAGDQEVRVTANLSSSKANPSSLSQTASKVLNIPALRNNQIKVTMAFSNVMLCCWHSGEYEPYVGGNCKISAVAERPVTSDITISFDQSGLSLQFPPGPFGSIVIKKGTTVSTVYQDYFTDSVEPGGAYPTSDDTYIYNTIINRTGWNGTTIHLPIFWLDPPMQDPPF